MTKLIGNLAVLIGGWAIFVGVLIALSVIFFAVCIIVLIRRIHPPRTDRPQLRLSS